MTVLQFLAAHSEYCIWKGHNKHCVLLYSASICTMGCCTIEKFVFLLIQSEMERSRNFQDLCGTYRGLSLSIGRVLCWAECFKCNEASHCTYNTLADRVSMQISCQLVVNPRHIVQISQCLVKNDLTIKDMKKTEG